MVKLYVNEEWYIQDRMPERQSDIMDWTKRERSSEERYKSPLGIQEQSGLSFECWGLWGRCWEKQNGEELQRSQKKYPRIEETTQVVPESWRGMKMLPEHKCGEVTDNPVEQKELELQEIKVHCNAKHILLCTEHFSVLLLVVSLRTVIVLGRRRWHDWWTALVRETSKGRYLAGFYLFYTENWLQISVSYWILSLILEHALRHISTSVWLERTLGTSKTSRDRLKKRENGTAEVGYFRFFCRGPGKKTEVESS